MSSLTASAVTFALQFKQLAVAKEPSNNKLYRKQYFMRTVWRIKIGGK